MQSYRTQVKVAVLMALGVVDEELASGSTGLDGAVVQAAGKALSNAERNVFYFLFRCTATWPEVAVHLQDCMGKQYDIETVKTYARRAAKKVEAIAPTSPPLAAWRIAYDARNPGSSGIAR